MSGHVLHIVVVAFMYVPYCSCLYFYCHGGRLHTIEESVISPVIGREASPGIGPETKKKIQLEDEQFSPQAVTLVNN